MTHGDAVIDRDRVEFLGDTARRFDLAGDQLAEILQMHMAGHELGEGVDDGDDRLAEIAILHARRAPQSARAGHVAAMGRGAGAISGHVSPPEGVSWRPGSAASQLSRTERYGSL